MNSSRPILIAGIGNCLCGDDGLGSHAVRELCREPIDGVLVVDLGAAILQGLDYLEGAQRVLLIDAVMGGKPPGTIYCFNAAADQRSTEPVSVSSHSLGWREALQLLASGATPPHVTVLGVEPESLAYSLELSPPVQAALATVVTLAREIVAGWKIEPAPYPARNASEDQSVTAALAAVNSANENLP